MIAPPPDRMNVRLLFGIAILGAVLAIVGWMRYFN
jgi:hypothetical protein